MKAVCSNSRLHALLLSHEEGLCLSAGNRLCASRWFKTTSAADRNQYWGRNAAAMHTMECRRASCAAFRFPLPLTSFPKSPVVQADIIRALFEIEAEMKELRACAALNLLRRHLLLKPLMWNAKGRRQRFEYAWIIVFFKPGPHAQVLICTEG